MVLHTTLDGHCDGLCSQIAFDISIHNAFVEVKKTKSHQLAAHGFWCMTSIVTKSQ